MVLLRITCSLLRITFSLSGLGRAIYNRQLQKRVMLSSLLDKKGMILITRNQEI